MTTTATRTPRRQAALERARELPVDPARMRELVEALSAIGSRPDGFRVTGTPEDRAVAALVAGRMRDAGLTRVAVEEVPVDAWRLSECALVLDDGARITGASLGGAPGTAASGVHAALVDVGAGDRRRLDRLEVDGRIALLNWQWLGVAPADIALELGMCGAVGIVLACADGGPFYQAPGAVGSFDSAWHAGAPPVLTVAAEDAAALRTQLRERDLAATLTVAVDRTLDAPGANVVGYLDGADPDAPPIVVGAHHDGWFRAAFDNATGVAALLAIAEGLIELGHRPRHTFAFTSRTAEEYGLTDTLYDWCRGAWAQVSETHPGWAASPFHLCLEASGHPGLRTIVEVPVELTRWARSTCRAADEEGWLSAGWRVGPPVTGTEQWPYLVSGVPGVATYAWETAFRRSSYHTPLDTPAIVDFDHLARVVRAYTLLLLEADADPDAIHDHRARTRHLAKAAADLGPDGEALAAAAHRRGAARGRRAFTASGRGLHAVDAHGDVAYPHAQAAADAAGLDTALRALAKGDDRDAIKALEQVGANRLTRVVSAAAFAACEARRAPGAERLSWAAASHVTASPDLWAELATLRGEAGARPRGAWLERSLRAHRDGARAELRRRTDAMIRALDPEPLETP